MRNKDKPWFDDQSRYDVGFTQEAHFQCTRDRSLVNWEEFFHCQVIVMKPTRRPSISLLPETGMLL